MPAVLASEGVDYASEPALPAKIAYSLSGLLPRVAPALLSSDDSAHQPALEAFFVRLCRFAPDVAALELAAYTFSPDLITRLVAAAETCPAAAALSNCAGVDALVDALEPFFRDASRPDLIVNAAGMLPTTAVASRSSYEAVVTWGSVLAPAEEEEDGLVDGGASMVIAGFSDGRGVPDGSKTHKALHAAAAAAWFGSDPVGAITPTSHASFWLRVQALPLHPKFRGCPITPSGLYAELRRLRALTSPDPAVRNAAFAALAPKTAARLGLLNVAALVRGMASFDRSELFAALTSRGLLTEFTVLHLVSLDGQLAPHTPFFSHVEASVRGAALKSHLDREVALRAESDRLNADLRAGGGGGASSGGNSGTGSAASLDPARLQDIVTACSAPEALRVLAAYETAPGRRPISVLYALAVIGHHGAAAAALVQRLPRSAPALVVQAHAQKDAFRAGLSFFLTRGDLVTFAPPPPAAAAAADADGLAVAAENPLFPPEFLAPLDPLPSDVLTPPLVEKLRVRNLGRVTKLEWAELTEAAWAARFSIDLVHVVSVATMVDGFTRAEHVLGPLLRLLGFDSSGLGVLFEQLESYLLHAGRNKNTLERADSIFLEAMAEAGAKFQEGAAAPGPAPGLVGVFVVGDAARENVEMLLEGAAEGVAARRRDRGLGRLPALASRPPAVPAPARGGAAAAAAAAAAPAAAAGAAAAAAGAAGAGAAPAFKAPGIYRTAARVQAGSRAASFSASASSFTLEGVVFDRRALEAKMLGLGYKANTYVVSFLLAPVSSYAAALAFVAFDPAAKAKVPVVVPHKGWFSSKMARSCIDNALSVNPLPPFFR